MKMRYFQGIHLWVFAGLCVLTIAALAQPSGGGQSGPGGGERPHGPPPEAVAACKGKIAGAECSFTGRQNNPLTGTCFAPPARRAGPPSDQTAMNNSPGKPSEQGDVPLACRPKRGGPGDGLPPQH
jgi:hypothetical protein